LAESPISRYKKGNTFMNRKLAEVYAFDIQAGDMVKDAEGRIYTAASNAELDQWESTTFFPTPDTTTLTARMTP